MTENNVRCGQLDVDLAQMDKSWRIERLSLKAAESLTKKQRDEVCRKLDEVLKKRKFMETETQKMVGGLEQ